MSAQVEIFIEEIENEHQRKLFRGAFFLIMDLVPDAEASIKWRIPFFSYGGKNFCYLNFNKKQGLTIGFPQGYRLIPRASLQNQEAKEIRHIYISKVSQLMEEELAEIILEAASIV